MSEAVVDVLASYGPWAGVLALWIAFVAAGVFSKEASKSFERSRAWLREDRWSTVYFGLLGALLDRLARWIGDADHLSRNTVNRPTAFKRLFGRNPWTPEAYSLCLLLSLLYPVLGLLGLALSTGSSGTLSEWVLLPSVGGWLRVSALLSLLVLLYTCWRFRKASGLRSVKWGAVATAVALVIAIAIGIARPDAGPVAAASALVIGAAFALAGTPAVALAGGVNFTIVVAAALAFVGTTNFAIALAGVVTIAIWVSAIGEAVKLQPQQAHPLGRPHALFWVILVTGVFVGVRLVPSVGDPEELGAETLLVFVVLMPLANAPLGWLSLGVTRGLLHAIRDRTHRSGVAIFWAIVDVVLALNFLALVSAATVGAIALANRMAVDGGGVAIVDLDALLTGIRETPGDPTYYWIYLMLLTTVVPTVLHAFVAALALVNWAGQAPVLATWRAKAAEDLGQDVHQRWAATTYLSLVPVAALVLAGSLVWLMLLALSNDWVLGGLISWLTWFAGVIQG